MLFLHVVVQARVGCEAEANTSRRSESVNVFINRRVGLGQLCSVLARRVPGVTWVFVELSVSILGCVVSSADGDTHS